MRVWGWSLALVAIYVGCGTMDCVSMATDAALAAPGAAAPARASGPQEAASPPDAASTVLYLGKSPRFFAINHCGEDRGILVCEFFRQALLIAAREELGLATRDAWLGDAMPGDGPVRPFEIVTQRGRVPRLEVRRGFSPAMRTLGDAELPSFAHQDYGKRQFSAAEKLSRTGFADILKKEYGARQPRAWNADLKLPGDIEDSLRQMSFLAQFKAVRQLHDLVAAQGSSPAILGALARGYANLGIMTEFHWHPAHKVFKARAILYAQRWLMRQPDSPAALWYRAYALTLTGMHADAMADLESAQKAWQAMAEKDRPQRPGWVALLDACCRYDIDKLASELDHAEHGQLAALLHYHTVELAGNKRWALQIGLATLKRIPECYRVHDGVCEFGGVSVGHGATLATFRIVGRTVYGQVRDMPGLPDSVRRQARRSTSGGTLSALFGGRLANVSEEFPSRARLIAALREASRPNAKSDPQRETQPATKTQAKAAAETGATSEARAASQPGKKAAREAGSSAAHVAKPSPPAIDAGEPSWAALAQLIEDLSFVHVWQRTRFVAGALGCSADDFLQEAAPLVADHPLRLLLEGFAWDVVQRRQTLDRAARLTPDGLELNAYHLLGGLRMVHLESGNAMYREMFKHVDDLARDDVVLCRMFVTKKETLGMCAKKLLEASPHSPLARAFLVDAGKASTSEIAQWKELAARYPVLAHSLGKHYAASNQPDEAIRCGQMAIKRVEESGLYQFVADQYLKKGDEDRWLKTLEAALQLPDYGLDHAAIQEKIAGRLMDKREWKRALPYAQAAAQSYSGWGLECAARCYEGLREWDKAEQLLRATAERYRSASLVWYYFCRRTGKGDLRSARDFAKSYLDDPSARDAEQTRYDAVVFYILDKQIEKALVIYRKDLVKKADPFLGLWVAILADELKDPKTRDAALERVRVHGPKFVREDVGRPRTELIQLAAWIERDLAQGGKGEIDLAAVEKLLDPVRGYYEAAYVNMFLARYLQSHGKREEAIRYWKKNTVPADLPRFARDLASATLNDLGIKLEDWATPTADSPKADAKPAPETGQAAKEAKTEDAKKSEQAGDKASRGNRDEKKTSTKAAPAKEPAKPGK